MSSGEINFKALRKRLDEVDRAAVVQGVHTLAEPPVTRQQYQRERFQDRREDRLPEDRTCPICKRKKLNSRQWVLYWKFELLGTGLTETVICVGCARTKGYPKKKRRVR